MWGKFREECSKEYQIGETCGLRLVFETEHIDRFCKLCEMIAKKKRRLEKMEADIERWKWEGDRPAHDSDGGATHAEHSTSEWLAKGK